MSSIGNSEVSVPNYFYKVVFAMEGEGKMIGFILPNQKSNDQSSNFSVTVVEVELISGLNFYHKLDDKKEDLLESEIGEFGF
jgi:endonuclease G